jgi:hypothetical protein
VALRFTPVIVRRVVLARPRPTGRVETHVPVRVVHGVYMNQFAGAPPVSTTRIAATGRRLAHPRLMHVRETDALASLLVLGPVMVAVFGMLAVYVPFV